MSNTLSSLVRHLRRVYETISDAVFWLGLQADRFWTWHEVARVVHREGSSRLMHDCYVELRFPGALVAA